VTTPTPGETHRRPFRSRVARWSGLVVLAGTALAVAVATGGRDGPPAIAWVLAADRREWTAPPDVRLSPGGAADVARWWVRSPYPADGLDRAEPRPTGVRRWLLGLLGGCFFPRRDGYVVTDLRRSGPDAVTWRALVREEIAADQGRPSRRFAGRWDVGWTGEPVRSLELAADGTLRTGRFEGRWSVVGSAIVLDVSAWDEPPFIVRGAALVADDEDSFEGAAVEPSVRGFRGRRVRD
jgi:hypothetical protein